MYIEIIIITLLALLLSMVVIRMIQHKTSPDILFVDNPDNLNDSQPDSDGLVNQQNTVLDEQVLDKLANEVSPSLFPTLLDVFVKELITRCNTINQLPQDGSDPRLRVEIHSLKSCARTFGATDFAEQAALIEELITTKTGDIANQIRRLQNMLPTVLGEFSSYQSRL